MAAETVTPSARWKIECGRRIKRWAKFTCRQFGWSVGHPTYMENMERFLFVRTPDFGASFEVAESLKRGSRFVRRDACA